MEIIKRKITAKNIAKLILLFGLVLFFSKCSYQIDEYSLCGEIKPTYINFEHYENTCSRYKYSEQVYGLDPRNYGDGYFAYIQDKKDAPDGCSPIKDEWELINKYYIVNPNFLMNGFISKLFYFRMKNYKGKNLFLGSYDFSVYEGIEQKGSFSFSHRTIDLARKKFCKTPVSEFTKVYEGIWNFLF